MPLISKKELRPETKSIYCPKFRIAPVPPFSRISVKNQAKEIGNSESIRELVAPLIFNLYRGSEFVTLAPDVGLEPTTPRLRVSCSAEIQEF